MGGGGTETTTQTSGPTNPMVDQTTTKLLTNLQGQVDKGTAVFNKPLYAGLSAQTGDGSRTFYNASVHNAGGLDSAYGWAQGVMNGGGYNSALTGAQNSYQGQVNSGGYNPALSGAQGVYQGQINGGGYNPALSGAQSGVQQYLRESQADAPGYAQLRSKAGEDTMRDISALTTASGRFGSGSHIGTATKALGDVYAGMDYQRYNDRLGSMLNGNQALAGIGQTAMGNMSGAASGLAGVGQTAMGNLGNATAGLAGVGQTAMGNAAGAASAIPALYDATLQPGRNMMQVGQMYDANNQSQLLAENDLFRRQNDAGWSTLGQASSILAGNAGASGSTTTTTEPTAPWWQQVLGAGAVGSGIYKNIWGN